MHKRAHARPVSHAQVYPGVYTPDKAAADKAVADAKEAERKAAAKASA